MEWHDLSVVVSVTTVRPAKATEPIMILTWVGPRNHY